jgi:hypothetical protein
VKKRNAYKILVQKPHNKKYFLNWNVNCKVLENASANCFVFVRKMTFYDESVLSVVIPFLRC